MRCPIVELRQYTLHPGQRDVLITLFDREFVESQEALGITVLGQFRDLDRPDRFVWLRGFETMPQRAEALTSFYSGQTWRANSAQANATMIDVDDVLLLRPVSHDAGFPEPEPEPYEAQPNGSMILATICLRDRPVDDAFLDAFEHSKMAEPLACLRTEYAENTFPALGVRTGEHAFVWFSRSTSPALPDPYGKLPGLIGPPQVLRLAPTVRSALR
jgi:hypothetical protein